MCKYKVQTWIRSGKTIYLDVYVKGENPKMQALAITKKYAVSEGYGIDPYIGIGNNKVRLCDQYDKHVVNAVYGGDLNDYFNYDKLLKEVRNDG